MRFLVDVIKGMLVGVANVIPGVSGSMVMMILGFYYGVINMITSFFGAFFAFDIKAMLECCILIIPFGIGVIVGIFGIAKLINYLFSKHGIITYCAIFGLVLASPIAILYNTGALSTGAGALSIIIGIVAMLVLGFGTYVLGKHE